MIDPKLLEKLKALGIDTEGGASPQWIETQPINLKDLPVVQQHREILQRLRDTLVSQLEEDQLKLEEAHRELERAKRRGGP